MSVSPKYESQLTLLDDVATAIEAFTAQARVDLDGHTSPGIDPIMDVFGKLLSQSGVDNLDVWLGWARDRVEELAT